MKNRLKELRLQKGWTQDDAAEVAGINQSTYQRLESGKRRLHGDAMQALAKAFCVEAYQLIFDPAGDADIQFLTDFKSLEGSDRAMVEELIQRLSGKESQQHDEL